MFNIILCNPWLFYRAEILNLFLQPGTPLGGKRKEKNPLNPSAQIYELFKY